MVTIMLISVFCIDDSALKYRKFLEAKKKLEEKNNVTFSFITPEVDIPAGTDEFDVYPQASLDADYVFNALRTEGQVIILLDLNGVGNDDKFIGVLQEAGKIFDFVHTECEVENELKSIEVKSTDMANAFKRYRGAFHLCLAAKSRENIKILLFTSAAESGEVEYFIEEFNLIQIHGTMDRYPDHIEKTLIDITLDSHERILVEYVKTYSKFEQQIWTHDKIQYNTQQVRDAVDNMGLSSVTLDSEDSKALFMASYEAQGPLIVPVERNLKQESLSAICTILGLPCKFELDNVSRGLIRLPYAPGILFLLSLRHMLEAFNDGSVETNNARITSQDCGLTFYSHSVSINDEERRVYQVRLGFVKEPQCTWGIARGYLQKLRNGPPEGGLSKSIFNVAHGRLSESKNVSDALISKESYRSSLEKFVQGPRIIIPSNDKTHVYHIPATLINISQGEIIFTWV